MEAESNPIGKSLPPVDMLAKEVLHKLHIKGNHASHHSLPIDLLEEILLRLPYKSLMRFKCVSKLWLSLIDDDSFAKSYSTPKRTSPLLIHNRSNRRVYVINHVNYHNNNDDPPDPRCTIDHVRYDLPFKADAKSNLVNGLLCFYHRYLLYLYNVTTCEKLQLPKPTPIYWYSTCGLGFDPNNQEYKLLHLWRSYDDTHLIHLECEVLTLCNSFDKEQETWRRIDISWIQKSLGFKEWYAPEYPVCIDGVLYWNFCIEYNVLDYRRIVMAFDVAHEKFEVINYPQEIRYSGTLAQLGGQISLVSISYCSTDKDNVVISVWRLLNRKNDNGKLPLWDKEVIECSFLDTKHISCSDFGLVTCVKLFPTRKTAIIQGYDLAAHKPVKFRINNDIGAFSKKFLIFQPSKIVENIMPLKNSIKGT